MKTQGQIDYEQEIERCPVYPGNHGKRPQWEDLPKIAKWAWNRAATQMPS